MILLIDNYDSFTYNLAQIIQQYCDEVKVVRNDAITLQQIQTLQPSGIVLSPGPGRPEQAGICVELVQHFSQTMPILGVCLGMQAIAVAFGAQVVKTPEIMHGKSSAVFHNRAKLYKNVPQPFTAGRYHSLVVEKSSLPDTLKIEAETADEVIMGITHTEKPSYGLQFHPESILSQQGSQMIQNFVALCQETVAC